MVTLQINGRQMSFSEEELIAIVEKHFSGETKTVTVTVGEVTYEIATTPANGKLFKVDPNSINRQLFEKTRSHCDEDFTRRCILAAFTVVDANPEKYQRGFYTLIPEKNWEEPKTVAELKELATILGGHMANWIEQALEWAQRISNGETWKNLCRDTPSTIDWYRLVEWNICDYEIDDKFIRNETGYRLIGGARKDQLYIPDAAVGKHRDANYKSDRVVPLVTIYAT